MANRVAATYSGGNIVGSAHRVTFTAPTPGARLIVVISSFTSITNAATGGVAWTQDASFLAYNYVAVYSRIATGAETSVDITASTDAKTHAVVYERDDCPTRLFTAMGQATNANTVSASGTVPAGAAGRVFLVVNSPTGNALTGLSYNQGMAANHTATAASSSSAFASGAMPAAGSRTWTVSNLPVHATNATPLAVVGYGTTDATPPTAPPNVRVTSTSPTDMNLAWDAATDNVAVTGYGIYVGGVKRSGDVTTLTGQVTGLTPNTSYTLAVDAVDASGNRSPQTAISQTTPAQPASGGMRKFFGLTAGQAYTVAVDAVDAAANRSAKAQLVVTTDGTPPTVPGNLHATAAAGTQISVAWDASTDALTGVAGYGVYLDGAQVVAAHPGLGWTFSGLTAGQTYTIAVDAVDGAGNRSAKAASIQVQAEVDSTPPTVPGNPRVTGGGPYGFTVVWDASTDPGGLTGYGIYLNGVKQGGDQAGLSYVFSGLSAATTYQVAVDAVDVSGNRSSQAQLTHMTPPDVPPGTPPNLRATAVSYTSFTVEWDAAADDVAVTGYDVTIDGTTAATGTTVRQVSRSELADDTDHVVRVWAVDQLGQRSPTPAQLTVRTLNDVDPTAPVLTAAAGEDSIEVAWNASSDDFGVVGYEIRVDGQTVHTTPGVDYTVDGVITRRHTITGLAPGRAYGVRVAAVDTIGQRSLDNTQQVATTALPYVPIETPVYRILGWAGNVRDLFGVDWVVTGVQGWSSSPPVAPASAPLGGVDGEKDGAGRYGQRLIVLEGTAIAPSRMAMLAAKQRLVGLLHPRQQALLRVIDARMARQVRVRLDNDPPAITDRSANVFTWRITVKASDPRRYALTPVRATAVIGSLPGQAQITVTMEGTYRTIPARLRLFGPIKDWTITHEESGTVMRAKPGGFVPADTAYSYTIDLGVRQMWAHVPPEVWPEPRPGRSALAGRPAWWMLIPGTNTITVAGAPVPGQPGTPRLALEAYDAWT
ncbi:fibronectin type III domain-containing protein [Nonomuraea sp. NPDC005650]|uniref:fibronectin type III domain-containing protein n=1 Tax=Nonomuraea sp. NPDC005650 TaxID=3157045 RepID=UPI0033A5CA83